VLLAADGLSNRTISERIELEEHCIGRWRRRFARHGVWGLFDRPRPGRPVGRPMPSA
jgi:transposase